MDGESWCVAHMRQVGLRWGHAHFQVLDRVVVLQGVGDGGVDFAVRVQEVVVGVDHHDRGVGWWWHGDGMG